MGGGRVDGSQTIGAMSKAPIVTTSSRWHDIFRILCRKL
jgi:hypothetical protein